MELSAEEIRVLGCLVEKQLTTPQAYPLTESAVITACNQTTNRDPVVSYDQSTVRRALLNLRQQGLAKMVHRPGDRVVKHRHLLDEALSLAPAEVAVLSVLLLRGPQTVGELRTRTERIHAFGSVAEVESVLSELAARAPEPLVERMSRLPGQKEARYRHLLGATVDDGAPHAVAERVIDPPVPATSVTPVAPVTPVGAGAPAGPDALAELRHEVAALRARVEHLETQLGVPPAE